MRRIYCINCKKYKEFKKLKYHIFVTKHYFFLVFVTSVEMKMKIYLKKKNPLRYKKIFGLIENI